MICHQKETNRLSEQTGLETKYFTDKLLSYPKHYKSVSNILVIFFFSPFLDIICMSLSTVSFLVLQKHLKKTLQSHFIDKVQLPQVCSMLLLVLLQWGQNQDEMSSYVITKDHVISLVLDLWAIYPLIFKVTPQVVLYFFL